MKARIRSFTLFVFILALSTPAWSRDIRPIRIGAAYLGQLALRPGAQLTVGTPLLNGSVGFLWLRGMLAGWVHPRVTTTLMLGPELAGQLVSSKGWTGELDVGAGYGHRFLASRTYSVSEAGEVSRTRDGGRASFLPWCALGVGKEFGWKTLHAITFRTLVAFQVPYNGGVLMHPALSLGAEWQL